MSNRGFLSGCNGVKMKMAIRSDGVMIPCAQLSHMELGRINRDSLKEVWQNHPELERLRNATRIPLTEVEFCTGCAYINYCAGSCPGISYMATGKENVPYPEACMKRFIENGGRLPTYE